MHYSFRSSPSVSNLTDAPVLLVLQTHSLLTCSYPLCYLFVYAGRLLCDLLAVSTKQHLGMCFPFSHFCLLVVSARYNTQPTHNMYTSQAVR